MGLYGPTFSPVHGGGGFFAWDPLTDKEFPEDEEPRGRPAAPPAAEVIANLRAQVADLKGRLGLLPGQAGKLSGARPAPPRAGAMTEARKREILAAHPSGKAVLADMDNDR